MIRTLCCCYSVVFYGDLRRWMAIWTRTDVHLTFLCVTRFPPFPGVFSLLAHHSSHQKNKHFELTSANLAQHRGTGLHIDAIKEPVEAENWAQLWRHLRAVFFCIRRLRVLIHCLIVCLFAFRLFAASWAYTKGGILSNSFFPHNIFTVSTGVCLADTVCPTFSVKS